MRKTMLIITKKQLKSFVRSQIFIQYLLFSDGIAEATVVIVTDLLLKITQVGFSLCGIFFNLLKRKRKLN